MLLSSFFELKRYWIKAMAIPQHTIDQVLDRVDLVDLISQHVKLKKTGRTYSGCCPFHQEKTPSFHVYREKAYYHCFGCQANGNAIQFLMNIQHRSFIDVMQQLASQAAVSLPAPTHQPQIAYQRQSSRPATKQDPSHLSKDRLTVKPNTAEAKKSAHAAPNQRPQGNLYDLSEYVCQYFQQQFKKSAIAKQYSAQRQLTAQAIDYWRIGYAPEGWQHLLEAFPDDIEGLTALGLIRKSDSGRLFCLLRQRLIFPIRDQRGRVIAFGGRSLDEQVKPKYINSPETEIFHKNRVLYGLFEALQQKNQKGWLVVEGFMDVIALHQVGITQAVAAMGTASNSEHFSRLFKYHSSLTLAFDGDSAGQKAAWRSLESILPLLQDGRELRFFLIPEEHDPDSLIQLQGREQTQQQIEDAPLLSDYLYSQLSQRFDPSRPEGKSQIIGNLKQLTQYLPQHGSYRRLLEQSFRDRLGLGYFKKNVVHDLQAHLSFKTHSNLEQKVIALLLTYPSLFPQFETLAPLTDQQSLLAKVLQTLNLIYEQLPDEDPAQQLYFILGSMPTEQQQLVKLLNQVNIQSVVIQPENLDKFAKELNWQVKDQLLTQRLKQPNSLAESSNLKQQLLENRKEMSLRQL